VKLLITTHSSRWFDSQRGSLNGLNVRFQDRSLDDLPPLESFPPASDAIEVSGKIAFWDLTPGPDERIGARLLKVFEPENNPQSTCFIGDTLAIASSDRIMRFGPGFEERPPLTDGWIAGTHTVRNVGDGTIWVTSAPANAALRIDAKNDRVIERLVMPACYGVGLKLEPEADLRKHFVTTDYQPTHINSAVPIGDELLVSLLVPGAIGIFDARRSYREIISGMRGCHGARLHPVTGEIYASDSPAGLLWYFDAETGKPRRRLDFDSRWLHDVVYLGDGILVGLASDRNSLVFMDERTGEILREVASDSLGRCTLFARFEDIPDVWFDYLINDHTEQKLSSANARLFDATDLTNTISQTKEVHSPGCVFNQCFELITDDLHTYEYLMSAPELSLDRGLYRLETRTICHTGGISIGLIDLANDNWLVQCQNDAGRTEDWVDFDCKTRITVRLVIAAFNPQDAKPVRCLIKNIILHRRE